MRKTIKGTEFVRIVQEAILRELNNRNLPRRGLLSESKEAKNRSKARKLASSRGGGDPNKLEDSLRHDIPNVGLNDYAFIYGVTRIFLDNELRDADSINKLNNLLQFISQKDNPDKLDANLGGMTLKNLYAKYEPSMKDELEMSKKDLGGQQFNGNSNYEIKRIDTLEDAKPYKDYTCSSSPWCITYMDNMWKKYTKNGEIAVYFALRKDFKNVPEKAGENVPLDDYGLSMLCVQVNPDGSLAYCTSRWNHMKGGSDHVMDERQLSNVVGGNFYSPPPLHKGGVEGEGNRFI